MTINTKDFVPRRDDDDDLQDDAEEMPARVLGIDEPESGNARGELPDIDAILAEYAETGRYVLLDRWESSAWTFLDRLDIAEAGIVSIKTRFGGGKFRLRIMGDDAAKKKQVTFRISGRARDGDESGYVAPIVPLANDDAETIRELRARLDGMEKKDSGDSIGISSNKFMEAIVTRLLSPPERDPLIGDLLKAVISKDSGGGDGVDPIELQKLLNSARSEGYEQGRALGEALATAVGDGDPIARVLATTLPSVVTAFQESQRAYRTAQTNVPIKAAATARAIPNPPMPAVVEETPVSISNGSDWVNALRPAVPMLLHWARSGKDASVKAANTVDDLNDDIRDAIAVQAEAPDFVQSVLAAIPEFQAEDVKPWIVMFLSTIQGILTEADDSLPGHAGEIAEA